MTAFVDRLAAEIQKDPSGATILSGEILDEVANVFLFDKPGWARVIHLLRDRKLLKICEPLIKRRAHELANVAEIGTKPRRTSGFVSDKWKDAAIDEDAVIPMGWGLDDPFFGAVHRIERNSSGEERKILVSLDPLVISRRVEHVDRENVLLEIAWKSGRSWTRKIYDRNDLFSAREIVKTSAHGSPVSSANAAEVVRWLQAYEHDNRTVLGLGYATSSMGWQGDDDDPCKHGFLCGSRQLGGNGKAIELHVGDGDRLTANAIRSHGSFDSWKTALEGVVKWPMIQIALYAALATPLIAILDAPNCVVEWAGRTSKGKTTALQVAQSCWRSGTADVPTWNATINGLEAMASMLSDLPLIVDDTSTAPEGPKGNAIGKILYHIVSGHGRTRSDRGLGQRVEKSWRTVLMTTGETPAAELARAEGAAARVLTLWGAPLGETSPETGTRVAEILDEIGDHYGHAGPAVVSWLCENRERWPEIRAAYKRAKTAVVNTIQTPAAARLSSVVALLVVSGWVAHKAVGLPWMVENLFTDKPFLSVITQALSYASSSADRAHEAWEHVLSYAESRPGQWLPVGSNGSSDDREPHGGWLGWQDADFLYWHPNQIKRVLKEASYMPEGVLRAWKDAGLLDAGEDRMSKSCRVAGPEGPPVNGVSQARTAKRVCAVKRSGWTDSA